MQVHWYVDPVTWVPTGEPIWRYMVALPRKHVRHLRRLLASACEVFVQPQIYLAVASHVEYVPNIHDERRGRAAGQRQASRLIAGTVQDQHSNGRKEKSMTTLELKLTLPDPLAQEAQAIGLLTPEALERLLREEIRRQRTERLFDAADHLAALPARPLSDDAVRAEIEAARTARRGGHASGT